MQQFQIKWNNHLKIFSKALSKYFEDKKFLDVILVVENGNHMIQCHKMVLAACSTYFANIFKCNLLEEKNPVICLPSEISLWEIQAILNYMYNGEVCISQEGLKSLVKCAEILQVKGLWRNENIENTTITSTSTAEKTEKPKSAASENNENFADMIIKSEINIDDENYETDYCVQSLGGEDDISIENKRENLDSHHMNTEETEDLINVGKTIFRKDPSILTKMNTNVPNCQNQCESIVCSPALYDVWSESEKDFNNRKSKKKNNENFRNGNDDGDNNSMQHHLMYTDGDGLMNEEDCNLLISSQEEEKKSSINGLYLRNPRGNQTRQYDVNSLYSALEDVRKGVSIYRAAQTHNVPRKTLRNWMKRLHIKSHFPMPKQLAMAAERKKTMQGNIQIKDEISF